jgi:two-component system sensor histidine kinase PhoQ
MKSLRSRLLAAASVLLAAFFVLTGVALESAFRDSAMEAQRDKLEGLVYALLAAARTDENGQLTISTGDVPDPRLRQPGSGLSAALFDDQGRSVWSSVSFIDIPAPKPPAVGQWKFEPIEEADVFSISYGLRWIDLADDPKRYTVVVLENAASFQQQLGIYRRELSAWLAGSAFALLGLQVLILRWGLSPLQKLVGEMRQVESGGQAEIQSDYPDELRPLTEGLNAMIRNERNQQGRYRNALGDLAHSLKTPLAVLRGFADEPDVPAHLRQPLQEQLGLMQQITDYQLRKAATAGRRTLAEPVSVRPIAEKIATALRKVYADKLMELELVVAPELRLRADDGDLYELIGNLLDNALKYGAGRARLRVTRDRRGAVLEVDDNGPGFPDDAEELLQRGARADTQKPGQGIGLAAVYALVQAYEGRIELGRSEWSGGRVRVTLPV